MVNPRQEMLSLAKCRRDHAEDANQHVSDHAISFAIGRLRS